MADMMPESRRCNYFFLYDGSKVKGEGDPTRDGICYFYPEETPIDKQELLCGQLAGVGRCVSELSSSPVRMIRLRRSKFAICMKDDFFWALGCSVDIPNVSVCDLLNQLINLFCFYNGSIRQSYQLHNKEMLAGRWAHYLSQLQTASTELHHMFSCLKTIDSTHIDPLLLLKAALILQACQRCPLVLAGCILFRGRIVSTQMPPDLTVKVMVHESETYNKDQRTNGLSSSKSSGTSASSAVASTTVFLTADELQCLRSAPVDKQSRSKTSTPNRATRTRKARLSRTLSDTPSTESDSAEIDPSHSSFLATTPSDARSPASDNLPVSPGLSDCTASSPRSAPAPGTQSQSLASGPAFPNGKASQEEEPLDESHYFSFNSNGSSQLNTEYDASVLEEMPYLNGRSGGSTPVCGQMPPNCETSGSAAHKAGVDDPQEDGMLLGGTWGSAGNTSTSYCSSLGDDSTESPLVPMTLYQHRVRGLVLALLVETHFQNDTAAMEEVYHSSLASLNGLEAHLRTTTQGAAGPQGNYIFAHFDCIQNTLTTNLSGGPGGAQERSFVRATSLLHSHFCNTGTLQEAIIRNAGVAVYGTHTVAQETYFLQQGAPVRNSGIPNHQDSAFSLPSKARHRLMKHGVNLF